MKRIIVSLLLALLCAGCGAAQEAETPQETPETAEMPEIEEAAETEDHVLLTLETAVDSGQMLRLEAVGKKREDMDQWGVREVRVYQGDSLIQTLSVQEAIETDGVSGAVGEGYTDCWAPEQVMQTVDMNFDGIDDLALFAWTPAGGNIPYYYWLWDSETGQFQYGFCLPNAAADWETEQIVCNLTQTAGFTTEYYQYDQQGTLQLIYSVSETYLPNGDLAREVYRLVDGQLIREE